MLRKPELLSTLTAAAKANSNQIIAMKFSLALSIAFTAVVLPCAAVDIGAIGAGISGDYLEVRSCDVFTGSCVANSEMNLGGKEGMLVWSVRQGSWKGTRLDGLTVIAIVRTEGTLGDQKYDPQRGTAVLIIDSKAGSAQQAALQDFARSMAGSLTTKIADVKVASVEVTLGGCKSGSCAKVKAGELLEISTRCFTAKDHLCGNEANFYPPLTKVDGAFSAMTEIASYTGGHLDATWTITGKRSAYLGVFAL
ncbi:MAG: DUF1326 domain-containing protein [Pedosphaera sp.]|nr:DUF1326 domain-containing protein [Pedosphaera sp.]